MMKKNFVRKKSLKNEKKKMKIKIKKINKF
jgi:hypothetical protein